MSMASCAILSNFFERTVNSKPPTIPYGIIACTFSDNLSRNSCIHNRQSNKQLFFSLEFVNILLQMEAKDVKNASSLLHFSGHSELETGLLTGFLRM